MRLTSLALALTVLSAPAAGEVIRIVISEQRPWLPGQSFASGDYELLSGKVYYEVDPRDPSSRDIADIALAPVNSRGKVEYSGPFLILRPANPARANGSTLVEIPNRGRTQIHPLLRPDSLDLTRNATSEIARTALFDLGYTFAWAGWQGDLKPDEFGLTVPTASVQGQVRSAEFLGLPKTTADSGDLAPRLCAADIDDPAAVMRLHSSFDDPGTMVPRTQWRFARKDKNRSIVADPCAWLLSTPVNQPLLATVIYKTNASPLIGLSQAAVRDFVSHLKHPDLASPLNARPGDARKVLGFGYSQSGRFLRDFLYRGFNADARKRIVFDGVLDTASGAGRGSFNHRYAEPGEAGNSVGSALRAVDLYPFANLPTPDIDGKRREGLLDRARRDSVQPRIMHILSSSEYWARAGSLLQTSTDGRQALPEAEATRLYAFAGVPHGPWRATRFLTEDDPADLPYNDNDDLSLALPALVEAMRQWVDKGAEPPRSQAPQLGTTLVNASRLNFPKIPGVTAPASPPPVWQLDLGPGYRSKGIIAEPPRIGARYPLLVPQVDADGNELGSWRGLTSSVPLGTYTAWNRREPALDDFGILSRLQGAFVPFPATKAIRERRGDPRRSIGERYGGLRGYMAAVDQAIDDQVRAGFLLPQERAEARTWMRLLWDRTETLQLHWPPPANK